MNGDRARVVRSASFDVFLNLALEDSLFRAALPGERTLFLWANDPAVVIGRYQNPWLECRLDELERDGVALARRQSGGGAVYHDRGNLCATFMGPRAGFSREANIALVLAALGDLGVPARANERNDVLADGRKVSGSAYRETADRAFHHLTLLVEADLERLGRYLRPSLRAARAKGVPSVRSPVANLREYAPGLTLRALGEALARRCAPGLPIAEIGAEEALDRPGAAEARERLRGWEWRFGSSPEFAVELEGGDGSRRLELTVAGGVVAAAAETPAGPAAERLRDALVGLRYSPRETAAALRALAAGTEAERFRRYAAAAER